ncbi:MAG: hypothetical protein HZA15_01920 [Nitrospirae bacterium]|nr:hypothetical protein [Nitrospirota bacterium]
MTKTIEVPVSLLNKISRAAKAFEEVEDEMDDFFLSSDETFLQKMRRARKSHADGKTRSLASLKKDLCIK